MYCVEADTQNLKLYVKLRHLDEIEMDTFVQKIEQECYKLVPGFTCLMVLPQSRSLKQKELDVLFNIEDLIYAYGANKMIRVNKNRFLLDQVRLAFLDVYDKKYVRNVNSIQEAEIILGKTTRSLPVPGRA